MTIFAFRSIAGWLTVFIYNFLLLLKIIPEQHARESVTSMCTETIYARLMESLMVLHKKYPNDIDLKRDLMQEICRIKFLEMKIFINSLIWKKDISQDIYYNLEKNFMRKISWELRYHGFVLEKE